VGEDGYVVSRIDHVLSGAARRLGRLRERSALLDHLWRAVQRYDREDGSRLAAAIAYYGFFATFALGVLLFAILGAVLAHNRSAETAAEAYLKRNLPLGDVHALAQASRGIGLIALVAMVLAGVWWVESLRSSQRALWCVNPHPGNFVVRYLLDLAVLAALGLLLIVSLAISLGLQDILLRLAGDQNRPLTRHALDISSALLAAAVDFVLATALLAGVPRLRIPLRRLLPSVLLIMLGLALLKTAGRWYVDRMTHNPAYQLAAGTIGLLIFMYLFNQIILLATALAATNTRGTVRDLAAGRSALPAAAGAAAAPATQSSALPTADGLHDRACEPDPTLNESDARRRRASS
jgi:membrane protein